MQAVLRLFSVIFVAVAVLAALADPASARQAFPAQGGVGDASNKDECPQGWYVIGFKGRTGAWIDQISITCARFNADFSIAETRSLPARGGNGGGPSEITCPKGHVVQLAEYLLTGDGKQVMQVYAECRSLSGGQPAPIGFGIPLAINAARVGPNSCRAGEAATGFQINSGKHVNAMGLICDELKLPPPVTTQAAPPPTQLPNESTAPLGTAADYAGKWATTTQKVAFDLTLNVNGNDVTGEYSTKANPAWAGTLTGTISPNTGTLNFSWNQPQINASGTGSFKVHTDDTIYGGITYKAPGAAKAKFYRWYGTRISRGIGPGGEVR